MSTVTKTIIANYGSSYRGKSSTIKKLYEEVKNKYPHFRRLRPTKGGGDVSAIIEINGVILGIESQGDPNSRIFKSLKEFQDHKCDIIITACRTWGATTNAVSDMKGNGYRLIWAQNIYGNESIQERLNTYYVDNMLLIIDDIMNGKL